MPSWFAEGTVTVGNGNAIVVGVGTKFSNCRSGDMFVGPDNGIYQVINPSSDTSVSISPPYRGVNSTGAAYGIVPVNGYPKALADAVNLMVQQWGSTLAGLGSVSSENIVPVAKGGTGATTPAAAFSALGGKSAGKADIIGTVSQSGGTPTGAVIERGSNANGDYVKFADGTLICHSTTIAITLSSVSGSATWTFPAAFSFTPNCYVNIADASAVNEFSGNNRARSVTTQSALLSINSNVQQAYYARASAFGRWF